MTDNQTRGSLLAAVDALTKPFILARHAGTDHDHQWTPVTRPPTVDELAVWKARRKPARRKVETGEFWCQWCNVTVAERPPVELVNRIDRREDPPLLDQLHTAVTSDIGGNGTGQAAHTRTPFDVGALTLYGAIDERVRSWIMALGGRVGKDVTLAAMLRSWYVLRLAGQHPEAEEHRYVEIITRWRTSILDILDPPEQIPYRGQPCPVCGETRARIVVAGDVEDTVALWAFLRPEYREEGSYGLCRACRTVLATDTDPIRLRARMNGAIAPATHLSRTVADGVATA